MFALTSSMSYFLFPDYVDMRKGTYSLYQLVKSEMKWAMFVLIMEGVSVESAKYRKRFNIDPTV